jgi:hypothetical protein
MLPYQMIAGGKFLLTTANIASGLELVCNSQNPPDYIELKSLTGWGESGDAQAIEWFWEKSMSQGSAKGILQSSEASTPQLPAMTAYTISSNGITTYDTANPPSFAALASSDIDKTTFVVTMASTGSIAVGDLVRVTVPVNMYQVSSYVFAVTAVTANVSITLGYMASAVSAGLAAFAANADTANITKFIQNRMYPRYNYIALITQASQAVVYFTAPNDFTPGEIVSFRVSSDYGMDEINNKPARVLSVTNSATVSSITIDLDTSGFTAFSFPTSAVALAGVSPAVVVPSSSGVVPYNGSATIPQNPPGTNLLDSFDNRNVRVIRLGPGLFNVSAHTSDNGDVWMWRAFKYDDYQSF